MLNTENFLEVHNAPSQEAHPKLLQTVPKTDTSEEYVCYVPTIWQDPHPLKKDLLSHQSLVSQRQPVPSLPAFELKQSEVHADVYASQDFVLSNCLTFPPFIFSRQRNYVPSSKNYSISSKKF